MDRHDNWLETENCFFDATVSQNEWNIDTQARDDAPASDANPSAGKSRVMTIGFLVIRLYCHQSWPRIRSSIRTAKMYDGP